MARQIVVLAFVLFAVVGLSYAAEAPPPVDGVPQEPPNNDIGTVSGDDYADSPYSVVPGPIGGPVPPGAFTSTDTPNGASALHVPAVVAAATAALAGFFCF